MKAAVLHQYGETPRYEEFPTPVAEADNQLLIKVSAASVSNLDKSRASGGHYSSGGGLARPVVVGVDGVGTLPDGTRVYAFGLTGMMAEQALADRQRVVPLPVGLDDVRAAALPNALMGSAAALRFRANVQPGETVLINGATGVTGRLAVQLARHYGAGRVVATGRNADSLRQLAALGAAETVSLQQPDEAIIGQLRELHARTPIDVVIDYLWGHPVELLLAAIGGQGGPTHPVRLVTAGGMAGATLALASGTLRSTNLTLLGSGLGSLSAGEMGQLFTTLLPELLQLAADGQLTIDTETVPLAEVATAWHREVAPGSRLVLTV